MFTHWIKSLCDRFNIIFLSCQFDDIIVVLENERTRFSGIDKKQKKFDQSLAEEKAISERYRTRLFAVIQLLFRRLTN